MAETVDQAAVLDGLVELERAEARLLGLRLRAMAMLECLAERATRRTGQEQFTVLEVAGSCRIGQQTATVRQVEAQRVLACLPRLLAALESGAVFVPQARVVIAETGCAGPAACAAVDAVVAERGHLLAPAQLRRLVRATIAQVEAADRQAEVDRLAQARAGRRVWVRPEADGMALIGALVPAEAARAFALGLDRLARPAAPGDDRTLDQRRADLLTELPLRALGLTGGPRIVLNVHVPMATVLDRSSAPGHLDGHGPLSAEHVRLLLPDADLCRVLVDATTGLPLDVDARVVPAGRDVATSRQRLLAMLRPVVLRDRPEPQYRPSAGLDRLVRVRDQVCSGPGCSQPASACDLDHLIPHPTGPTSAGNLTAESRRCHRAKHNGWTVTRHHDGAVTWVSPLGRRYHRPPPHSPPPAVGPPSTRPVPTQPVTWGAAETPLLPPPANAPARPSTAQPHEPQEPPF